MEYIINLTTEGLAELEICETISRHKKEIADLIISSVSKELNKFEEMRNQFLDMDIDESTKSELIRLVDENIKRNKITIDEIKRRTEGTH